MLKKRCYILLLICVWFGILTRVSSNGVGGVVKREERRTLVSTEYGEISAVEVVADDINGSYLLHFFTLDPNSLFLPVILHANMVFYVHTGSGKLSWTEGYKVKCADIRRGDAYRLEEGAVFFIESNLETETERQKLRIHAIFANSDNKIHGGAATAPYSNIRDMVLGFDKKVLQASFMVPEEKIEELLNGSKLPAIVHGVPETKTIALEKEALLLESLAGSRTYNLLELTKKRKKGGVKLFNLFNEDKDFENCNGWSTTVTGKKMSALKGTNIGIFMVNLTAGSMMGPHWNPTATEIAVVLQGRGMLQVLCSDISNEAGCRNMRYEVRDGDVFAVPKFHAMAQMAFNNETLVFAGFSTSAKRNHPQYLAGQASVFRTLDKNVLALAFNVTNTTMDQLFASQQESVILGCISCAEEELRIVEEEIKKEREAAREREEEEARKREEEEMEREREEARKREEEEARKREEEEAERQEEERRRQEKEQEEEEERKRQEEEARKREEEEERKRQEEEEERKRQEEEAREREEEEARKREEEEAGSQEEERRRQEEEEEEERKRQEEEAREREEAAAMREREKRRRREEEEEARRQEEEEARRQEETEDEEERKRHEEEARKREEAAAKREEEERRLREEGEEYEESKRQEEEEEEASEEEEQQHGWSEEERAE